MVKLTKLNTVLHLQENKLIQKLLKKTDPAQICCRPNCSYNVHFAQEPHIVTIYTWVFHGKNPLVLTISRLEGANCSIG